MSHTVDHASRPIWEKALEFSQQVAELATKGAVSESVHAARLASCRSCEKIDRSPDGLEYCGACDCGRWPLARLDRKLYFPALTCPLGRAGFANEGEKAAPESWKKCEGCSKPDPDRSPIAAGAKVVIVVALAGELPDLRIWTVEASRGEPLPTAYDLVRRRRWWTFDFWRRLGRPERATISRDAIQKAELVKGARP